MDRVWVDRERVVPKIPHGDGFHVNLWCPHAERINGRERPDYSLTLIRMKRLPWEPTGSGSTMRTRSLVASTE